MTRQISTSTFSILTVDGGQSLVAPMAHAAHVFVRATMMSGAKDICTYKRYALNNECY